MKVLFYTLFAIFAMATILAQCPSANGFVKFGMMPKKLGANGGNGCMGCTMFITLLRNVMQVYNVTGEESIDMFCAVLPDIFHEACLAIQELVVVVLANKLDSDDTPDVICYSLTFCVQDPGHDYCHLHPIPEIGMESAIDISNNRLDIPSEISVFDICNTTAIRPVCVLMDLVNEDYTAKSDDDADTFSTIGPLRGHDWRGKDCSDVNSSYYPGRIPIDDDREFDSNCNGIYGVNPDTGIPYEVELCGDQDNFGTIVFGDSIGAHFHIPPDWFRANVVDAELLQNLTYVIGNEADWPHLSYGTGHINSTWAITIDSPTNSIYWRMRDRNLCEHRDYQNLAFNGASSVDGSKNMPNMTREDGKDNPAFVIYAMYGNDICSSDDGSVDGMTPVDEFVKNVNASLAYLDTRLPYGSHVITVGLVNGTYLYSILKGRLHPIGELNGDITYDIVYNYFECLEIVCPAWTNTNTTKQQLATAHAVELSNALRDLSNSVQYSRFDVHYLDCPLDRGVAEWDGELWELIEPVDGLHPSKYGQDMFAQVLWEEITEQFPEILGAVNPNNDVILQIFGDQGGIV